MVKGDISTEVISTDFEGMVREGEKFAAIAPNIVVKIPMIKEGIKALKYFKRQRISKPIALLFFPPVRPSSRPRRVLPISLRLSVGSTTATGMEWS